MSMTLTMKKTQEIHNSMPKIIIRKNFILILLTFMIIFLPFQSLTKIIYDHSGNVNETTQKINNLMMNHDEPSIVFNNVLFY